MQVTKKSLDDTSVSLSIIASQEDLTSIKEHVLGHFVEKVKIPGFRAGKAPLSMVEKSVDPSQLQTEFIDEAVNHLYQAAINETQIRPVDRPTVTLQKFVPYTTLEFEAVVTIIGNIILPDYKNIKIPKSEISVTSKDVEAIVLSLQKRQAEKIEVARPAKNDDELIVDFEGVDSKGKAIPGADGKDYPLELGSKAFIPGFEDNLVGLKTGDEKTFKLTFPKDYNVKTLANQKVTFSVKVKKVAELKLPELTDEFATKAGPFKSLKELKTDINKQLTEERQREADGNRESELVKEITHRSKFTVPKVLVDDQIERTLQELKQNLTYRGQTYQEYLDLEGKTDEQNREELVPGATERVKAGLVLSEIAEKEKLSVTPEELEVRMQLLKGQYKDAAMQAELEKPEARRDIASRLLTEKTLSKLSSYSQ